MKTGRFRRFFILFGIGGLAYNLIEILWRGYSHWSMFLVGGSCFQLIGRIGKRLRERPAFVKGGACALAVTAVEYVSGCLFNLRLKLNVWDYSHLFGNLHGQICLLYSVLWGLLSLPAMSVYSYLEGQISRKGHSSQRGERASHISRPNSTSR